MQRRLFFLLFHFVMTGLAEGLQVRVLPEQALVTPVRLDVVAHQPAGVAFSATALGALEQIAKKDAEAERAPSCRAVPPAPGLEARGSNGAHMKGAADTGHP
jgi:hypothetical protein